MTLNKYFCFSESVETDSYMCRHDGSVDDFRCYGCAYIGMSREIKPIHYDPRETRVEADKRTQDQYFRRWDK